MAEEIIEEVKTENVTANADKANKGPRKPFDKNKKGRAQRGLFCIAKLICLPDNLQE